MENVTSWDLDSVSPDGAYQLGLMVANMVKVALEEAVDEAATRNIEAFRKGVSEGLRKIGFDPAGLDNWLGREIPKKRVTARKASVGNGYHDGLQPVIASSGSVKEAERN